MTTSPSSILEVGNGMDESNSSQRLVLRMETYKSLLDEGFPVPDFLENIEKWQFLKDIVFNHSHDSHADLKTESLASEQYRACTDLDPGLRSLLRCLCEGRRERLSELMPLIQRFLLFERRIIIPDQILLESIPILCMRKPLGGLLKGSDRKIQYTEDTTPECLWVWETSLEALPDIPAVRDVLKSCKDARDRKSKKVKLLHKLITALHSNNLEAVVKHEDSLIKLERKELMEEEKRARKLVDQDKQRRLNEEEKSKKGAEPKEKKEEKKKDDMNNKNGSSTVMFSWLKKVSTTEDIPQREKCPPHCTTMSASKRFPGLATSVDIFLDEMEKPSNTNIETLRSDLWKIQLVQNLQLHEVLKYKGTSRKFYRQVPLIGTSKPTKTQLAPSEVINMQKGVAYNNGVLRTISHPRKVTMHIACDWKRPTRKLIICRKPHSVHPASPLAKEESLNYDIDTDEEWEEQFGGEDVNADDNEEEEDDDIADVSGWMVPDDVVDYETSRDDDIKEDGGPHSPSVSKLIQGHATVSCCFEGAARLKACGDGFKEALGLNEFKYMTTGKFRCDMREVINFVNGINDGMDKKPSRKREMSENETKGLALFIHGRTDAGPKLVDEFAKANPNLIKRSIEEQYKHIAVREKRENDTRQFVYVRNDAASALNVEQQLREIVVQRRPNAKDSEDISGPTAALVDPQTTVNVSTVVNSTKCEETQKGRKRSATDAAEDPKERHRKKKQATDGRKEDTETLSAVLREIPGSQRKMRRTLPLNKVVDSKCEQHTK